MEETLFDMLPLCNSVTSIGAKTELDQWLEMLVIESFSCRATDDVMSECFGRWSKQDIVMNNVVMQVVSSTLFIRPRAGFIKQHVDVTIDECRSTQIYVKTGKVDETDVPITRRRSSSDAVEKSENMLKREGSKNQI